MTNLYKVFESLLPKRPLQVGSVTALVDGLVTVQLVGGGIVRARGVAEVGQQVFVRDGVVEGEAPLLPVVPIEI